MLPSTGYFKAINCPFYDSGLCERPYCHFKHPRREDGSTATILPVQSAASNKGESRSAVVQPNSNTLQELVSEAVKKVLAGHEGSETGEISQNIVSRVVEELDPSLTLSSGGVSHQDILITQPTVKPVPCVYNPTPIAELKKRHIPVIPYMPTRDSKVAVKRKTSPERFKPWLSLPQNVTNSLDNALTAPSYSTVKSTEITYKPTAISNSGGDSSFTQSYVPTIKSDSSSPNSYEDGNSSDYVFKTKDEYRPRSKKRREEYIPKKLKAPLNSVRQSDEHVSGQFNRTDLRMQTEEFSSTEKPSTERLEFRNYDTAIEPQFSDEEEQNNKLGNDSIKGADKIDKVAGGAEKCEEKSRSSHKSSSRSSNDGKSKNNGNSAKPTEKRSSLAKDKEKAKTKSDKDRSRKERRSGSTNDQEKDSKDAGSRERSKDKEKHKHSSSSKEKRHSSSSDKGKSRQSSKERRDSKSAEKGNEKKNKDSSRSSREKDRNVKRKSEERHKSNDKDKHKSKSSSSSSRDKHSSNKTDKKSSRSSGKSTSSSKKSDSRKTSNDEISSTEEHDEKENSPTQRFRSPSPYSEEILEISDSDHDIEEECLKIFQEYEVSEHPKEPTVKDPPKRETDKVEEPGKKRVAHASASEYAEQKRVPSRPPKVSVDPQQKLLERWRSRREAIAEKIATVSTSQGNSTTQSSQQQQQQQLPSSTVVKNDQLLNGNGRLRIAHVPYATSLALAKKKVSEAMSKNVENRTVAQTAKSGSRVAHVPQVIPQLIRPEPLQATTQKFPLNVRQYYVNMMQDICIQIYTNGEDAAQRALREEFACHERCKAVAVYKNSCMLATHRLRKELDQQSANEGGSSSATGTVSHEAVLAGKSKGSWSVVKTKRSVTEFKGATLYAMLSKWIMTEEQLRENGYPRPHPDGPTGRVKIYVTNTRNQTILSKVANERFCSRCNQPYMVDKYGNAVVQENCIYHWGRKFTIRGEGKYSCCQQYGSASGCCDAKTHVWDYVDYENLRGYVKTLPKDNNAVEEQGVYALDCEMSYTTQGLELTRVTVINEDCNVIYETLVKPDHPVIDYNTRFSGITEQNMEGVTTTLLDVQATLLSMFSDKTILIGHSLESDFKALKLLHDSVVDTSIMFPHRNGYPQKRALRNLCSEYLQKIIQNDVGGHDSNEDAVSCMELAIWKLKEEAKSQ